MRFHAHAKRYCFCQGSFWSLSKRKKKDSSLCLWSYFFDLVMLCYIFSCFSWHILLQGQEFWVLQLIPHVLGTKIEIYYSPVTIHCYYSLVTIHLLLFMTLFTPKFCLFKGGCPLYLEQVFLCLVQDFFLRESFPLRAFPCENILAYTSYSTKLVTLKPCNYFQLVITTTVSIQVYFQ